MTLLANCPLPWDSGSTHGSLAESFHPAVAYTWMIPASHPLSAASYKVICVIKYCRLLFYHPVIIPYSRNTKPSKGRREKNSAKPESQLTGLSEWSANNFFFFFFPKYRWVIKDEMCNKHLIVKSVVGGRALGQISQLRRLYFERLTGVWIGAACSASVQKLGMSSRRFYSQLCVFVTCSCLPVLLYCTFYCASGIDDANLARRFQFWNLAHPFCQPWTESVFNLS